MMITILKELRSESVKYRNDELLNEYSHAITQMFSLLDAEVERNSIADDRWTAAELRSMAGEQL